MRLFFFLMLFATGASFAEDTLEQKLAKADDDAKEALFEWRAEKSFKDLPNEEYVKFYTDTINGITKTKIGLLEESCKTDKPKCQGSYDDVEAPYKILIGQMNVRQRLSKDGKTKQEIEQGANLFVSCATAKLNCDGLSEEERKLASEAGANKDTKLFNPETDKPSSASVETSTSNASTSPSTSSASTVTSTAAAATTPTTTTPPSEPEQGQTEAVSVSANDDEKSPRNYKSETCTWVSDLPRRIVNGPSCGKTRSKICTGYVVCDQKEGGLKFVRMSTCRAEYCDNEDAVKCTQDKLYFSRKPADETKQFVSGELKKALSGSTEQ